MTASGRAMSARPEHHWAPSPTSKHPTRCCGGSLSTLWTPTSPVPRPPCRCRSPGCATRSPACRRSAASHPG
ncbi:hypothetical protein I553_5038 [Mycobacterium xenopi 4042]|uniref:Uncharacterized protein n=1 Tax=Mycobacterium xenopi 4042 TaxID=1299334 RepID=X7ZXS8_MYCXE|nr:hypothetical protein I553_5038 [Mycobacterium xenopi 4042]